MKEKTYAASIRCGNCYSKTIYEIKRGTTISEFKQKHKKICQLCGCQINQQKREQLGKLKWKI